MATNDSYEVMGITETLYVGTVSRGENCKFDTVHEVLSKHRIYVRDGDCVMCIQLSIDYCESYSGWCEASLARIRCERVEPFSHMPFTHVPKKPVTIEKVDDSLKCIHNAVFSYTEEGDDSYYPSGSYDINWDLFVKTIRYKDKRVVYILTGDSAVGKTYLANHMQDIDVYETDMSTDLPVAIYADVIVIGNRSGFTLEQVKARVFGPAHIVLCRMTTVDGI